MEKLRKLELVHGGNEYFAILLQLIENAKQIIQILVYILDDDDTGQMVSEALIRASKRGVQVVVLVDAFGSKDLSQKLIYVFKINGIPFRKFSPHLTGNSFYMGRMLHIKLTVVDSSQALIGGINISDDYNDNKSKTWLDYAALIRDPSVCKYLNMFCSDLYNKKVTKERLRNYRLASNDFQIQINDWFHQSSSIYQSYNAMIENSRKEVIILSSYFLPSYGFMNRLTKAAQRGVNIHLINSARSDVPFMKGAIRYFYPWLQRKKINLYEWKSSIVHAKVMVVDRNQCTIGSYNLNSLSRFNSLEMNVQVTDLKLVDQLYSELYMMMTDEENIEKIDLHKINRFRYLIYWMNYQLIRLALKLMFLLMNVEKQNQVDLE